VAVRADGTIVPCSLLPHEALGRINRDSLSDLWGRSGVLHRLRSRKTIPLADFAFCEGCGYIPYCTGNCPGGAYTLTGRIDHPAPEACLKRFLEEGGRLP
jgi:radical SAM protein with 4Fe4S-binding SPASM domain